MTTEQGTFDDVLDRLDFDFYDYDDEADLFQKLSSILYYGPSQLQMQLDTVVEKHTGGMWITVSDVSRIG